MDYITADGKLGSIKYLGPYRQGKEGRRGKGVEGWKGGCKFIPNSQKGFIQNQTWGGGGI